jgi:TetR/AcrR family transcriptional regulator
VGGVARAAASPAEPVEHKVKEKLHSAAAEVFARKGYAAATVREIVQKAGVTKPVLYYYYGSKEGIYKAVLDAALRDFEDRLAAVENLKGNATLRLTRLCEEVYSIFRRHTDVIRLMHAIYYGPPQGAPFFDFDKALFRLEDGVSKIVRQGLRAGEFHGDAGAMTRAVLGVCNECIDLDLVQPERTVGEAGFRRTLDVVFRGMKRTSGR